MGDLGRHISAQAPSPNSRFYLTLLDSAIPVSPLQVEQPLAECFWCVAVVVVGVVLLVCCFCWWCCCCWLYCTTYNKQHHQQMRKPQPQQPTLPPPPPPLPPPSPPTTTQHPSPTTHHQWALVSLTSVAVLAASLSVILGVDSCVIGA